MSDFSERERNVIEAIRKLDITPTMFVNAKRKYEAIANYLQNHDVKCDFYPQGSFATGTIVRPLKYGDKAAYDLDAVCKILVDKKTVNPDYIKNIIGDILKDSDYKLDKEYETCWTIKYAEVNDYEFSIDIVPAVDEDEMKKSELIDKSTYPELIPSSIAITFKENQKYNWHTNNPKGLVAWFDTINKPYKEANRQERRMRIFNENKTIFASVEDIPEDTERSALQIAIQLLKRHRDLFYNQISKHDSSIQKPTSAIILVLSASIAESFSTYDNPFELVSYIVQELKQYSELQIKPQHLFSEAHIDKNTISKSGEDWCLKNPANPEDNLLDSWNNKDAKTFFNWIDAVYADYSNFDKCTDQEYAVFLENSIGHSSAELFKKKNPGKINENVRMVTPAKPWSMYNEV